jgi:hypothetical protein
MTDRLLSRVEALSTGIRKLTAQLAHNPPNRARLEARLAEYKQSIRNIQEHGRETAPEPIGTKIDVPADVMRMVKER